MTEAFAPTTGAVARSPPTAPPRPGSLRIAVLDRDSGFIQVLSKRLDRLGWEHRVLASPVPADAVVSMRLSALVVDLAVLGPQAWSWLERLCGRCPSSASSSAPGRRRSPSACAGCASGADDWITKPCHPEEVIARVQSVVRRRRRSSGRAETAAGHGRRGRDPLRPLPGLRRRAQHRPDAPRVRADRAARRRRGPRARARGDLLAAVGLHDGPRRPLGRRVRAQAPPEAREGLARAGATSTPTSASATASPPNRSRSSTRATSRPQCPPTGTPASRASSRGRMRTASSRAARLGAPPPDRPSSGRRARR